ncbi:hypothetical protein ACQPWW_23000 [Micromonospora sp. CA-240977]
MRPIGRESMRFMIRASQMTTVGVHARVVCVGSRRTGVADGC